MICQVDQTRLHQAGDAIKIGRDTVMDLLNLLVPGTLQQVPIGRIDQSTPHSKGFKIGTATRGLEATTTVQPEVTTEHEIIVDESHRKLTADLEIMVCTIVTMRVMAVMAMKLDEKIPSLWYRVRKLPHQRRSHDLSRSLSTQDVQR